MFGKKKKDNKLNVEIVTVNKGQPTEHYLLAAVFLPAVALAFCAVFRSF